VYRCSTLLLLPLLLLLLPLLPVLLLPLLLPLPLMPLPPLLCCKGVSLCFGLFLSPPVFGCCSGGRWRVLISMYSWPAFCPVFVQCPRCLAAAGQLLLQLRG
jgi:hypothetical protein